MPSKKCPVCGASVKLENLEKHVKDQHPRSDVKLEKLLTTSERRKVDTVKAPPRAGMTRRGKQTVAVAGVVIAVIVAIIIVFPMFNVGLAVGQKAPDFSLRTTDGVTVRLSDVLALRHQPVLLEFMDVDCAHCINMAPTLVSVYGTYSGRVTFFSIDVNLATTPPDDTAARIEAFKTTHGSTWQYLNPFGAQFDQGVISTYQISGTPTFYILTAGGYVSPIDCPASQGGPSHCSGEVSSSILSAALDVAIRS